MAVSRQVAVPVDSVTLTNSLKTKSSTTTLPRNLYRGTLLGSPRLSQRLRPLFL